MQMRDIMNIINEDAKSVPQQIGQWAFSNGGQSIDKNRVAVKVMDTSRYLKDSAVFVVIKVEHHESQGFNCSVDLMLGLSGNTTIMKSGLDGHSVALVDGHSFPRVEDARQVVRYAQQLFDTADKTVSEEAIKQAAAEFAGE